MACLEHRVITWVQYRTTERSIVAGVEHAVVVAAKRFSGPPAAAVGVEIGKAENASGAVRADGNALEKMAIEGVIGQHPAVFVESVDTTERARHEHDSWMDFITSCLSPMEAQ